MKHLIKFLRFAKETENRRLRDLKLRKKITEEREVFFFFERERERELKLKICIEPLSKVNRRISSVDCQFFFSLFFPPSYYGDNHVKNSIIYIYI